MRRKRNRGERRGGAERNSFSNPALPGHAVAHGVDDPVDETRVGRGSLKRAALDEVDPEAKRGRAKGERGHEGDRLGDRRGGPPDEHEDPEGHRDAGEKHDHEDGRTTPREEPVLERAPKSDAEAHRIARHVALKNAVIQGLCDVAGDRERQHPQSEEEAQPHARGDA